MNSLKFKHKYNTSILFCGSKSTLTMQWYSFHVVLDVDGFLTEVVSHVIGQLEPFWEWMDHKGWAKWFGWSGEVDELRQVLKLLWRRRWSPLTCYVSGAKSTYSGSSTATRMDQRFKEDWKLYFHDLSNVFHFICLVSVSRGLVWRSPQIWVVISGSAMLVLLISCWISEIRWLLFEDWQILVIVSFTLYSVKYCLWMKQNLLRSL